MLPCIVQRSETLSVHSAKQFVSPPISTNAAIYRERLGTQISADDGFGLDVAQIHNWVFIRMSPTTPGYHAANGSFIALFWRPRLPALGRQPPVAANTTWFHVEHRYNTDRSHAPSRMNHRAGQDARVRRCRNAPIHEFPLNKSMT